MKLICWKSLSLFCLIAGAITSRAQPVDQLAAAYSGKLFWDQTSATLCFSGSGNINFAWEGARSFIWKIPADVKRIRIAKGVTVNGAFHSKASVTIAGEDRKTSVVYGTQEQSWPQQHDIKAFTNSFAPQLLRQGCAWAAGLAPAAGDK